MKEFLIMASLVLFVIGFALLLAWLPSDDSLVRTGNNVVCIKKNPQGLRNEHIECYQVERIF